MKKKLLLSFLFFIVNILSAQQLQSIASIDNFKNIHTNITELRKTIQDSDGSSYLFGTQDVNYSTMDVFVIKLDQDLDTLWTHIISTPEGKSIDDFQNAEVDSNGNIYIYSRNFVNANFYQTDSKHFITKLDSNGTLIYRKSLEDVATENNEPNNYTTTNFSYLFSHLDDDNRFVLVYSAHSPLPKITFFRFAPNNTTSLVHRTDLLAYNPATDPYGYFLTFFYNQGHYYYTLGVKQASTGNPHVNRLNKMLNQGFLTLDITPYVGTNQILLAPDTKDLKSNSQGDVLYFNFDQYNFSSSFFTVVATDSLQFLGAYNDTLKKNKFDSSYVLPNGDLRIFSRSTNNLIAQPTKLTETIINTNGTIVLDTVYQDFTALDLVNINATTTAIVNPDTITLVDNNWSIIKQYHNINVHRINSIAKKGADYYVYSNEWGYKSDLFQSFIDNITTHTFKLVDNVTTYPHFSHQGDGTAHCRFSGATILLSDGSRIIFYSCDKGCSIIPGESKDLVKKIDSNLNPIWENEMDTYLISNLIKDDNDYIYFGNQTLQYWITAPYPVYYFLTKMSPDGNIVYEISSSQFNNIFLKDGYLYTTMIQNNVMTVKKHNKNNGSLVQQFTIPQNRLVNQFIDTNDDVYFFFGKENPTTYGTDNYIVIYKNFVQIAEVYMGTDYIIPLVSLVDPVTKSLYFGSHKNSTSVYTIFKINVDGSKNTKNTAVEYSIIQEVNNSVYFRDDNKLYQINKLTLNIENEIPVNFASRFLKKEDKLIHTVFGSSTLTVYDENLTNIGAFNLEDNDFSYIYFTDDNKIHQFKEITERYLTQSLPRWMINRMKLYDFNDVVLSMENNFESLEDQIRIFPNPFIDLIYIEAQNHEIQSVEIYTINGKYIEVQKQIPLTVSHLTPSIYLLKITTADGKLFYSKVIKNKN